MTSGSDIALIIQDLFFRAYMSADFIKKHVSACDLYFRFLQYISVGKDQVDVIVCHRLIMMKCSRTLHSILFSKSLRKELKQDIRVMPLQAFRKSNDQFSRFDTFSCFLMTAPEVLLCLPGKILPEFRLDRTVEGV